MTGSDRGNRLRHQPTHSSTQQADSTSSQTDAQSQLNRSFSAEDNRLANEILNDVKSMSLGERFVRQKKTRVKYDQLLHFMKDAGERVATGEKLDVLDAKIVNNLEETSEDLKLLSSGKEVALDACYMVENVHLMRERVKMLQEHQADKRLNVKIFAEKMVGYTKKLADNVPPLPKHDVNPLLVLDDDEEEDEEELPLLKGRLTNSELTRRQWAAISHNYELVRNVSGIGYLRPLLTNAELQPTIAKKKKEKMDKQVQRQKKEAAVILEQKEKGENMGEDQSVTIELDFIRKTFLRLLKKTESTSCNYYEFIFDPDDFGRTVENMFHVSFLLRDASMLLRKDTRTGLPILVWVPPEKQRKIQESAKKEPLHQQTIFAFTQQHWKEMKTRLPIQRAIIKPLEQRQRERERDDEGEHRNVEKRHHDETTEKKPTKEELKKCRPEGSRSTGHAKKMRHEK
ncbi:unnamed protein product, partial [Mesorhabditis belari]|uniref:Non-structural maintenance of chromosomes element 4 n=1 Tax=Mesorhabditis belari TaxID=2138241 RepID=A0AAF3F5J6_9BILA